MAFGNLLVNGCIAGMLSQNPVVVHQQAPVVNQTTIDCVDRHALAGYRQNVAWWAIPSDTGSYTMSLVGGGCPYPSLAQAPFPGEGTWGWEYVGNWVRSHVIIGWWHGRRYQGGTGAYQTDTAGTNHGQSTLRGFFEAKNQCLRSRLSRGHRIVGVILLLKPDPSNAPIHEQPTRRSHVVGPFFAISTFHFQCLQYH